MFSFAPRLLSWPGRLAMTPKQLHIVRRPATILLAAGALLLASPANCHALTREHGMWWSPPAVTVGGHLIDQLLNFIFWLTTAVFVITQVVYIWFIIKYRRRPGVRAIYSHGNNRLEMIWTSIPAMVFIMLAIFSNRLWSHLRSPAPADALRIDIVAYQFGFHIRNPGADGKLGSYSQLWLKQGENTFGQDLKDDAALDDYQTENQLTIPVNRPINIVLRSMDVIHAFYVPEFRMYQDIVPGREIDWVWFVPDKTGHYALACNQLCGAGHYNMQAKIDVVSQEDYDKLVKEKSASVLPGNQAKQRDAIKAAAATLKSSEPAALTAAR